MLKFSESMEQISIQAQKICDRGVPYERAYELAQKIWAECVKSETWSLPPSEDKNTAAEEQLAVQATMGFVTVSPSPETEPDSWEKMVARADSVVEKAVKQSGNRLPDLDPNTICLAPPDVVRRLTQADDLSSLLTARLTLATCDPAVAEQAWETFRHQWVYLRSMTPDKKNLPLLPEELIGVLARSSREQVNTFLGLISKARANPGSPGSLFLSQAVYTLKVMISQEPPIACES